jgi:hypothetical protein
MQSRTSPSDVNSIFVGSADGKGHMQIFIITKEADNIDNAQVERPCGVEVVRVPLSFRSDNDVEQIEAYEAGR